MTFRLLYTNRRGAGCVEHLDGPTAREKLKALRCHARLETMDGTVIGGIDETDNADDGRVRWNWWFDSVALGVVVPSETAKGTK